MRIGIFIFCFLFLSEGLSQNPDTVNFTSGQIAIEVVPDSGLVKGSVTYDFTVYQPADSILISARNLDISSVLIGKEPVAYEMRGKLLVLRGSWKAGNYKDLVIQYRAFPDQAVYFPGWRSTLDSDQRALDSEGGRQVWTQGQGKYTSSWLPSFDDMNEKVTYSMDILFPAGYEVLANGRLTGTKRLGEKVLWKYRMKEQVSSYLLAFVAGHYDKKELRSVSGVPISLYYYPGDSLKVTSTYRYTREIFDFLEREIGVDYPWENYKQVPVRDFLYAGMENVSLTVFSDTYVTDSIGENDKSYVNVNAHEMAHHWFGNLVTEVDGKHHWLHEGFATYYALLTERYLFGDDHYYWKLYDTALKLSALSQQGKGEAVTDPGAGSLTFYEKGAMALHILRERVGESAFRSGVKKMLQEHAFGNITTSDFLDILSEYSDADLDEFRATWLEAAAFPEEEAIKSLERNDFVRRYLEQTNESAPAVVIYNDYIQLLKDDEYYPLKHYVLKKAALWPVALRDSLWSFALKTGDLHTRQGVILAADTITPYLRPQFESLLDDPSYVTIEEALFKLWMTFPDHRESYLQRTGHLTGFEDRSLRILWLGLAIFTPEYEKQAPIFFEELTSYTGSEYQFEVRQRAMNMLYQIGGFSKNSSLNLLHGIRHPAWQFSRFCRSMLDTLLVQPEMRIQLRALMPELPKEIRDDLRNRLEKVVSSSKPSWN